MRIEPAVSLPIAARTMRAATATAAPLLDPPATRTTPPSQGLRGLPRPELMPQPPKASSTICVRPAILAPASSSRCTACAVPVAWRSANIGVPTPTISPAMSMLSLIAMDHPASDPSVVWGCEGLGALTKACNVSLRRASDSSRDDSDIKVFLTGPQGPCAVDTPQATAGCQSGARSRPRCRVAAATQTTGLLHPNRSGRSRRMRRTASR